MRSLPSLPYQILQCLQLLKSNQFYTLFLSYYLSTLQIICSRFIQLSLHLTPDQSICVWVVSLFTNTHTSSYPSQLMSVLHNLTHFFFQNFSVCMLFHQGYCRSEEPQRVDELRMPKLQNLQHPVIISFICYTQCLLQDAEESWAHLGIEFFVDLLKFSHLDVVLKDGFHISLKYLQTCTNITLTLTDRVFQGRLMLYGLKNQDLTLAIGLVDPSIFIKFCRGSSC